MQIHPRLGVSTWSLKRVLTVEKVPLLELPAQVAAHGFGALEIVHFHLPSTDAGYLRELRAALADAGLTLHALLIDTGDPTHPEPAQRERELATMAALLDAAGTLGAKTARVIAGDAQATPETLDLSARELRPLADRADALGVRLTTENWHRLLDHPQDVLAFLDRMEGRVGLKLDFGNWPHDRKHDDLPLIADRAESTHAKAFFTDGDLDRHDFTRCLDLCQAAGFSGTHALIFDSPGDEWEGLETMRQVALPYLS